MDMPSIPLTPYPSQKNKNILYLMKIWFISKDVAYCLKLWYKELSCKKGDAYAEKVFNLYFISK